MYLTFSCGASYTHCYHANSLGRIIKDNYNFGNCIYYLATFHVQLRIIDPHSAEFGSHSGPSLTPPIGIPLQIYILIGGASNLSLCMCLCTLQSLEISQ